jgi:stringent starvation protein B
MGSPDRPPKQEAFLALLAEGWTSLHLDARRDGVIVPAHLKGEPHLVLQYGHDLPIPIPDLQVDEHGVTATLSFKQSPSPTVVPWSAVYVVTATDGRGVLYQEDIPSDVSVIAAGAGDSAKGSEEAAARGAGDAAEAGEGALKAAKDDPAAAAARVAARTSTPRALRAVPLSGPIDEDPSLGLPLMAGPPPDALVPSRRRRRPQLRLVK